MSVTFLPSAILDRCSDPARSELLCGTVLARAAKAMRGGAARFAVVLLPALEAVPDPERALLQLDRYLEAAFSPSGVLEDVEAQPHLLEVFFRLIQSSDVLADFLVRDPELFRWLATSGVLAQRKTRADILAEADDVVSRFRGADRRMRALKRFQRRELLRIAARDLLADPPLEDTVTELSWLADAVVAVALREAVSLVRERYDTGLDTPLCVIALGKWGGEELNYSSDIDFMIVYGERREEAALSAHDLAVKTTELLVRFLTDPIPEGMLYRCDLRLRPDGGAGATALSMAATLSYYESRGALWERQMLIRARPAAGDEELGAALLTRLRPFVYPRALAVAPSRLVGEIRERLAVRWGAGNDVKHGRGGIRDIEFGVQALQHLRGGGNPALRLAGTLAAIDALARAGDLSAEERDRLSEAYRFLRRVEHLLQLRAFEQTHTLPTDERARRPLAWALGCASIDEFDARLAAVRAIVREISDTMLFCQDAALEPQAFALHESALAALGFRAPAATLASARALMEGRAGRAHPARLHDLLREQIGAILEEAAREALPDECVRSLDLFLDRSPAREAAGACIADPRSRRVLLRLASLAPSLLRELETAPLALDLLLSGNIIGSWDAQRQAKLACDADAVARYLLGAASLAECAEAVTRVADGFVERVCATVCAEAPDAPFVVGALGKYGAHELSPGSDLDVIFLYRERGDFDAERAQETARRFVAAMQDGGPGPLYTVDARLRPEGGSSPLATSIDAYETYLRGRASLWEHQSLLRFRIAAGSTELARRVRDIVAGALQRVVLTSGRVDEIDTMRRRMEPVNRFRADDFFDVKRSPGGLVDIEFCVQLLALRNPSSVASCGGNTFALLEALDAADAEYAPALRELTPAYERLRRLQLLLRVLVDTPSNLLPADERQQTALAYASGYASARDFLEAVRADASRVRLRYDGIVQMLRAAAPQG